MYLSQMDHAQIRIQFYPHYVSNLMDLKLQLVDPLLFKFDTL